jgi:hypothetical protein
MGAVRISGDAESVRTTGTNLAEYLSRRIVRTTDGDGLTMFKKGDGEFIIDFKELKEFIKGNRKSENVPSRVLPGTIRSISM